MEKNDLISVIMPVYESSRFLNTSIKSILDQTYKNFELLIIYDNSVDESLNIINKFKKFDNRIKLIYGNNSGIINALNLGINYASGSLIARMDSDDISFPDRFFYQVNFLKRNNIDICGCNYSLIDSNGLIISNKDVPKDQDKIDITLSSTVPFAHGSVLFKTNLLRIHNLIYSNRYANFSEDYQLWVDMRLKQIKFGNSEQILYYYRIHNNTITDKNFYLVRKSTYIISDYFINNNIDHLYNLVKNEFNIKNTYDNSKFFSYLYLYLLINKRKFYLVKYIFKFNIKILFISLLRLLDRIIVIKLKINLINVRKLV